MAGENKTGEKKSESKTSQRRLTATERQQQALELRRAGVGFQEIADEVGYASPSGAYKAVTTALKKTLQEPADEVRRLELERLDRLFRGVWEQATSGDTSALDRALKIMNRRAELLGLDAPEKHDVTSGGEPMQVTTIVVERPEDVE